MKVDKIKEGYKEGDEQFANVSLAGRLMSKRIMGKASFAKLWIAQVVFKFI